MRAATPCATLRSKAAGTWLMGAFVFTAALLWSGGVSAQPSQQTLMPTQQPLLVSGTNAKPNIVMSLDNSGSMAYPFPDGYFMRLAGWRKEFALDADANAFFEGQRSAQVNTLYYDPRITYEPRKDANGSTVPVNDGIVFVSNAESASMSHSVYAQSLESARNGGELRIVDNNFPNASGVTKPENWVQISSTTSDTSTPVNKAHLSTDSSTPPFTYVICDDSNPQQTVKTKTFGQACTTTLDVVDIKHDDNAPVKLPKKGSQRTDCAGSAPGFCSHAKEVANILNWYRYYRNRMEATKTALGQALQKDNLPEGMVRMGYRPINMIPDAAGVPQLGKLTSRPWTLRGVRPWIGDDRDQFFKWLYGNSAGGSTPLRRAYVDVGNYLQVTPGAVENPWAKNPSRASNMSTDPQLNNPELSCRRSFQVVLSDGGWNDDDLKGTPSTLHNEDATTGPTFKGPANSPPIKSFTYQPEGSNNERKAYTPYPGEATGGLADLAAEYYWHTDLRPQLDNEVKTSIGKPTFWQNLRTYVIGYMIRPSGEMPGAKSGLTFQQINTYRNQYVVNGYSKATKPTWPAHGVDLATTTLNTTWNLWQFTRSEADRVDDFIQSGYTGGGRSFSVQTAADIRNAIESIINDILDTSGTDAGIALGSASNEDGTLDGRLKFKVEYRTTDNVGNIVAQKLDKGGDPQLLDMDANQQALSPKSDRYWSAQEQIASPNSRNVYSMGDDGKGIEFKGRLDQLPKGDGIRAALRSSVHAAQLPEDASFINYLRGLDPVTDTKNQIYRLRASSIGAIVNSAPVLLDNSQRFGYDDAKSTISGKSGYVDFRKRIALAPDVLFTATNAGVVHALDAANGKEIAAYMPRLSMRRLVDQAQIDSQFRYVLDGPLSTHDIYDGSAWNSLVLGTGGRGERVVYALRPRLNAQGAGQMNASDFLWETGPDAIDQDTDGDKRPFATGFMTNPARSGQTDSGEWVVVLNSGHYNGKTYSTTQGSQHGLVVLNAMTGAVLRTISLPPAYDAGRGLGGVTLVRDSRWRIVAAYAGDGAGHLWRFDLRGEASAWKVSYGQPLFTTEHKRPIYAAPAWQAHPKGGFIVVAGTGMLLEDGDATGNTEREAIYGIWDPTSRVDGTDSPTFSSLTADKLLEQKVEALPASTDDDQSYFVISRNRIDWQLYKGWKLQLGGWGGKDNAEMTRAGERVIEQISNLGSSVVVSSAVIDRALGAEESCTDTGAPASAVYVLDAVTGAGQRAFKQKNDKFVEKVAMVFVKAGGYARGFARFETTPEAQMTDAQKAERLVATKDGEGSYDDTSCRGGALGVSSVGKGGLTAETSCVRAWSRQQYQLMRVPQ